MFNVCLSFWVAWGLYISVLGPMLSLSCWRSCSCPLFAPFTFCLTPFGFV